MSNKALGVEFDHHYFVVGLEWRWFSPAEKLFRSTLDQLREEGMKWYAGNDVQGIVGICSNIAAARQTMHSAALHLANRWSNGGLELFAFGLPQQRVAVVALNDRRPIPGYDFVGNMQAARRLIDEFETIHRGQIVRRVGDLQLLADEEQLSADTVFDQPGSVSKLRSISNQHKLSLSIGSLILLACALGAIYYANLSQANQEVVPQNQPPDPNLAYNQKVKQQLGSIDNQSQVLYAAWVSLVTKLPLTNQGWSLTQVECAPASCTAEWKRQFGSADDFYSSVPLQASKVQSVETEKDLLAQRLQTRFETPAVATHKTYQYLSDLPEEEQGFRSVASWLQDLSLIGASKVQIDKAQFWQAPPEVTLIKKPLFKGTWSVELPLGLTTDLVVPPFATVTALKVNLDKHYQLSGEFYVRATTP
jgi:hypothetical protein